mmetsp:Transcript_9482/g.34494  ORF Transcript_9482/g.34494 Transcript_9482/m.34494 type:complete len:214 (-) Transcript_9482:581-1222(-)
MLPVQTTSTLSHATAVTASVCPLRTTTPAGSSSSSSSSSSAGFFFASFGSGIPSASNTDRSSGRTSETASSPSPSFPLRRFELLGAVAFHSAARASLAASISSSWVFASAPTVRAHTRAVLSYDPDAKHTPSGDAATEVIVPSCPTNTRDDPTCFAESPLASTTTSHARTTQSCPPLTTTQPLPSSSVGGSSVTATTGWAWPSSVTRCFPFGE